MDDCRTLRFGSIGLLHLMGTRRAGICQALMALDDRGFGGPEANHLGT